MELQFLAQHESLKIPIVSILSAYDAHLPTYIFDHTLREMTNKNLREISNDRKSRSCLDTNCLFAISHSFLTIESLYFKVAGNIYVNKLRRYLP